MMGKWISGDGRWAVEPIVLDGRPCYRVMGPGMRGPEYVNSDAELKQRLGGDVLAMLIDPDDDGSTDDDTPAVPDRPGPTAVTPGCPSGTDTPSG